MPIWKCLPDYVVCAETANTFKSKVDKYWSDQEVLYDLMQISMAWKTVVLC